jgi:predicted GIY-YIG superfamily endonuclease
MEQYNWVYRLVNHNKKEIYHGITKNPGERLDQHCNNNTKTIAH